MQTAKQHNANQGVGESEEIITLVMSKKSEIKILALRERCAVSFAKFKARLDNDIKLSIPLIGSPNNSFDVI
jgi:hypothetical protein